MSKGDSVLVYLRYGPPTTELKASRDGRSVRVRQYSKWILVEEVSKSGKVVRTNKIAQDAVISIEEHHKGEK